MNYNLTKEKIKEVKVQFESFLEIQDEKKALAEAEKETKEKVAEIIDGKKGDASKLLKLMLKKYNSSLEVEEDIWSLLELITSPNNSDEEDSGSEEEEDS